jgi:hypothetical protein
MNAAAIDQSICDTIPSPDLGPGGKLRRLLKRFMVHNPCNWEPRDMNVPMEEDRIAAGSSRILRLEN